MIEFKAVHKWFGSLHVLNEIDLFIKPGEVVVVCGPSGSGKSTLIRCINRLEPIQKGNIIVDGISLQDRKTNLTRLRAEVGMVFQQFNLYPHKTALQNIMLAPMKVRKQSREEAEKIAKALMAKVGIPEKIGSYPANLSGGQQQRVAIARTLALEPRIILMDEPFSALDEPTRLEMQELIVALWHRIRPTILCVTHSISEAVYLGDRVFIMTHAPGQIAYCIRDVIPPSPGIPPLVAQERPDFKNAVRVVTEAFRRVAEAEAGAGGLRPAAG